VRRSSKPINHTEPLLGLGHQHYVIARGDAPAVEGRAHLLAWHSWQIKRKADIPLRGGRKATFVRNEVRILPNSVPKQTVTLRPPRANTPRREGYG
jgi:hypothetical protein